MTSPREQKRPDELAALRRLQDALRRELRTRMSQCRYAARCPVAAAGACPGVC